ncbi:MAG: hypothetical protein B9S32_09870 [Verrucomicrobia bacterium Tous-C9LFEB]|nr:MAG: hypothetical protein B9S32_09870 [Verrucomicrobia bacterium Tous-C9LFEB]
MNRSILSLAKLLLGVTLFSCLPVLSAHSAESASGSINLIGRQGADFEVTKAPEGGHATTAGASGGDTNLFIDFPITHTWKQFSFTITPKKSGRILILILGPYVLAAPDKSTRELTPMFVCYDDFKVEGTEFKNGGFEKIDKAHNPIYWDDNTVSTSNPPIDDNLRARLEDDNAPEGRYYARVWHNSRYLQALTIEQGTPVTITFYSRLDRK